MHCQKSSRAPGLEAALRGAAGRGAGPRGEAPGEPRARQKGPLAIWLQKSSLLPGVDTLLRTEYGWKPAPSGVVPSGVPPTDRARYGAAEVAEECTEGLPEGAGVSPRPGSTERAILNEGELASMNLTELLLPLLRTGSSRRPFFSADGGLA
mmetsp:Transcript_41655/g.120671  ORF Transcript_41655/g.120671 Transcript_41655/m.120671 type:complete len:152 (-) Transcript_41655:97-552(-)